MWEPRKTTEEDIRDNKYGVNPCPWSPHQLPSVSEGLLWGQGSLNEGILAGLSMMHKAGMPTELKGHLRRGSPPHEPTAQWSAMQTPSLPAAAHTSKTANPQYVERSPSAGCSQRKSGATSRLERPPNQTLKYTSCKLRCLGQTGTHTVVMTSVRPRGKESTSNGSLDICRCLQVEGRLRKETKHL